MSWKKRFNTVNIKPRNNNQGTGGSSSSVQSNSTKSWLPQFYQGSFDRIARYMQYDHMDYDVDINMALDTITEFSTLISDDTNLPFQLDVSHDINSGDVKVLSEMLKKWCRLNEWNSRLFDLFRNTIKYGDQVLIRDPETFKLLYTDVYNVTKILVNEEEGKIPEYYFVKNLSINLESLVSTDESKFLMNIPLAGGARASKTITNNQTLYSFKDDSYGSSKWDESEEREVPVSSTHVVHVSRSTGMDNLWPFGRSILDSVFKPFKQKELLEDAIIIYRVQRSPERLLFKIDTGGMPPNKADRYIEQVATKFRQKRMPVMDKSKGETIMDTTYNPMAITEDFFFAQGADGRGSSVEVLPGGECLTLNTEIKLINGEVLSLSKIIERFENGEQLWSYTVDPYTGVICPGMISWAGVTRQNTSTIRLHFDDGSTVQCTPDHKFPIPGKGYVEAQEIELGEEFYVLNDKYENGEIYYYDEQRHEWIETEEMFDDFFEEFAMNLKYKRLVGDKHIFENKPYRKRVKLTYVENMPNMDTGTLTIDGNEFYTDNHTFPLANGIFTKNSTGSIEDLKFFTSRMIRGLRVPIAYMSYLTEDGQTYQYNDGKVGTAYMEEFKFSKYCERLQRQIIKSLNREFKLFVKNNDIEISSSDYDISFVPPQSFSEYRQIELDTAQLAVFQSVADVPYLSKRFIMKRFMGLSDTEIKENEDMWKEEHNARINIQKSGLADGGVNVPSDEEIEDVEADESEMEDMENEDTEGFGFDVDETEGNE